MARPVRSIGGEQNGDGEHRRRRRGRRGGRRNRRGRDGEGEGAHAGANGGTSDQPHDGEHETNGARQGFEPEVADAVADLGGGPSREEAQPQVQSREPEPQPFEPVARNEASEAPAPAESTAAALHDPRARADVLVRPDERRAAGANAARAATCGRAGDDAGACGRGRGIQAAPLRLVVEARMR